MERFIEFEIVPDVIPTVPNSLLEVTWKDVGANLGSVVTPTQMKDEPILKWEAEANAFYTVMLVDPDAPSRQNPQYKNVLHWLVVNVPGCDVSAGELKTEYCGSGAPKGTGLHRYVFLTFKQKSQMDFKGQEFVSKTTRVGRPNHNTSDFIARYCLELVAGNFAQAEWDEYVPLLQKQQGLVA